MSYMFRGGMESLLSPEQRVLREGRVSEDTR